MHIAMKKKFSLSLVLIIDLFCTAALEADEAVQAELQVDPAQIIAYQGNVFLTQDSIDEFIRDGSRVDQLIRSLLQRKIVAADASKAGFDQDPVIAERMVLAAQKELADAWLEKLVEDAPEADYESMAYEDYLANPETYRSDEAVDVSHILIGTEERSPQDAEVLARTLRARLEDDPASFDALVMEYSDDPSKSVNAGRFPEMKRGQMVISFENAVFELEQDGEIAQPVKTEYGYHIIRLNRHHGNKVPEYDEVKNKAMEWAKQAYLENYQQNYMRKLFRDPIVIPDGAVEIMAKRHFGENLELAPNYQK
jgi:peptidyl-prolyl cis-trans isomerase C